MKLNIKGQNTYETISKIINGELTRKEAAFELHKSRQQIYNLIKVYNEQGKEGFIHKNKGKIPSNKLGRQIIEEIESLYLDEYYDFNFEAFYEELMENKKHLCKYDISYSSLHRCFLSDDIISPIAHKETIKLYNERMNNAINSNENIQEEKVELFQSRQIAFEKAHIRSSSNMYAFGQEVQMDASSKIWFGDIVTHLLLAVDKGTKKVLFDWFEYEEITRAYFIYYLILLLIMVFQNV